MGLKSAYGYSLCMPSPNRRLIHSWISLSRPPRHPPR
jgi:hypothetical protein